MEKDWMVVFTTTLIYKAEMIKDSLQMEEIDCVILNKMDSSYLNFGKIELLVKGDDVIRAKHVINKMDI